MYLLLRQLHTIEVQVYTELQPDKVPEQPFPHKFTDKTDECCQVSNYQHVYNIFSSQIKCLHILCPFLNMDVKQKLAYIDEYTD